MRASGGIVLYEVCLGTSFLRVLAGRELFVAPALPETVLRNRKRRLRVAADPPLA